MSGKRRILILEGVDLPAGGTPDLCPTDAELVRVRDLTQALGMLRNERFDAIYADVSDSAILQRAQQFLQADHILESLDDGVAVIDPELRITWANLPFRKWCEGDAIGQGFYEALGSPQILGPDYSPLHVALAGQPVTTRLHCRSHRYLDLHVSPISNSHGNVFQMLALCRDVTREVQKQQKLDAIHQAGSDLAALAPDQLAEMSVGARVELLKDNIRRLTHDLLQYDVIEIRLLDRQTGKLEPLLADGMTPEAARRDLYARQSDNGVTGFVAATGKSYLCPDTATDPLYIEGAAGARSSLTVPLVFQDQVIGTFNVESPQPNAFAEHDLQFTEIFCRDVATALHTLELLQAEKLSTASKSIEAVNREVVLPADEILTACTTLLDRYIGHEPEMADKLRQIITAARAIKQCIHKVGEDLAPAKLPVGPEGEAHHRLKGQRVLVADSDERVRRSAHGLLDRFGCVVETARDAKEALTMARLSSYDAILADIRLPDMCGYDAYHRLKKAQPRAHVILMTTFGYDPSHSIVRARQEGLRFVLYKPFRVDQLLDALASPGDENSASSKTA